MKKLLLPLFLGGSIFANAQAYNFNEITDIEHQNVISQGRTGTCWSFSTTSFIEAEIYRMTKKNIDISEMYNVRMTYPEKAQNYVMRQGKAQFSEGGLAHDVINSVRKYGLVPQQVFTGLVGQQKTYNHKEIVPQIKEVLDLVIHNKGAIKYIDWKGYTNAILDERIGKVPQSFTYNGKAFNPKSFQKMVKFKPDDYITLTSFTHQPYYTNFILNIPDNFSYGTFYNLPLEEWVEMTKKAVQKGYSVALDCDVSEKTFSAKYGVAFLPENASDNEKGLTEIVKEKKITPAYREQEFNLFNTTDDHLMHIVGWAEDAKGNGYFKVKNSWGGNSERVGNNGYIYMSVPYFKAKAISVLLHKEVVPKKYWK